MTVSATKLYRHRTKSPKETMTRLNRSVDGLYIRSHLQRRYLHYSTKLRLGTEMDRDLNRAYLADVGSIRSYLHCLKMTCLKGTMLLQQGTTIRLILDREGRLRCSSNF